MSEKWCQSEIGIVINDKSQSSIAKHLRNDELLHCTFIIQSAGERIFRIGEHLTKLQAKWLIVLCLPFALHFCPQRCWSRQISWITCALRTETVTIRCYFDRLINVSLLSTNQTAVEQFWLTDWYTDAVSDWPTADHVQHFAATAFVCCGSCVQWVIGFFICPMQTTLC